MPQIYHSPYLRSPSPSQETHLNDRPHPTNADDTIVLSDLLRTGEASRLRRRGAMRLDNNPHPANAGTDVVVLDTPSPWHYDEHEQEQEQGGRRVYGPRRRNAFPVPRRRVSEETEPDEPELDYRYTLVCGGIDPAAEGDSEEDWDGVPFKPSVLPLDPPVASSSSSSPIQRRRKTNGCGAVLHMYAAPIPTSGRGEWSAQKNGVSADVVLPLDAEYFSPGTAAQFLRNSCGCVREGVGCAVCGNPLGIRYIPCSTAIAASSTGTTRPPRPHITKPSGPLYWSGFAPSPSSPSNTPSSAPYTTSSSSNSISENTTYTFLPTAVTSYPPYIFPSSSSTPTLFPPAGAAVYPNVIDTLFPPSTSSASPTSPIYDSELAVHTRRENAHAPPAGWHGRWDGEQRPSRWGAATSSWGAWGTADGWGTGNGWDVDGETDGDVEPRPGVRIGGGDSVGARVNVGSDANIGAGVSIGADTGVEDQQQGSTEEPPTPTVVPIPTPETANPTINSEYEAMRWPDYFRELYATSGGTGEGNPTTTLHRDSDRNSSPPMILTHLLTASPTPIAPAVLPGDAPTSEDDVQALPTSDGPSGFIESTVNYSEEDPATEERMIEAFREYFTPGRARQRPRTEEDEDDSRQLARLRGGSSGGAAEFYQLPTAEAQFLLEWGADELLSFNGNGRASGDVDLLPPSTSAAAVRLPSGVGLGLGVERPYIDHVSVGGLDGTERIGTGAGQFERLGLERLDGLELSRVNQLEIQGLNELDSEEDGETVFTSSDVEEEPERAWGEPIRLPGNSEIWFDADGDEYVVRPEERRRMGTGGGEKEGASPSLSVEASRFFWVER